MSCFRNFLLFFCFLLTACGFRPLYHTPCEGSDVSYPIKIATISDRQGQILRNFLLDLLTPEGVPAKPKYTLEIKLTEVVADIGVKKDETTSRKKATLTAELKLRDSKQTILYVHNVSATNSFAILSQNYYSDIVATEYAKNEALRLLAEKIKLVLSAYIDSQNEN